LAPSQRRVLLSVNPRAGAKFRSELVEQVQQELEAQGLTCEVFTEMDRLRRRAEELDASGELRAVVAAGGDGTIALLANQTPPGATLAIFPLGTENLLSKHFGLAADAAELARIIADGYACELDMGDAGGRLFSLMAGCGFDADVVRRLHDGRQGNIHHLSYIKPILDSIRNYEYPELRIRYAPEAQVEDDLTEEITARWAFVVNVPRYAGGLNLAPGATGDDGVLDLCTFREGSLWSGLVYLGGIMLGNHETMTDFTHVRTRRLMIESTQPVPYQLDGDPGGVLPVEIFVRPKRLKVLVSREWALRREAKALESKIDS
jgi:diacylglycerol kinase (ATP)